MIGCFSKTKVSVEDFLYGVSTSVGQNFWFSLRVVHTNTLLEIYLV